MDSQLQYFNNVMTKFMINNRTDTQKTAVNLLKTWLRISKVTGIFEKGDPGHFLPKPVIQLYKESNLSWDF